MKVIHIVGSIDKSAGGPSRSVPQTCENVSELGIEIELITRPSANPVKVNTSNSFKLTFCSLKELIFLCFTLSRNEVSIIHLQHVWDPYITIVALAARIKRIPYIITPRGMLEPWIMNRNKWKKNIWMFLFQQKDIKCASCIHTTCEMEMQNVRNLGFSNPMVIIPNGIDLSKVPNIQKKYGSKKMVFLSRIHQKKGIEVLIEAWKRIDTTGWKLEIAGDGEPDYVKHLSELIQTKQLSNVTLVGSFYGDAKWTFLQSADLFVLPTYSENFGIAIAEALVVGVPVITTKGTPWCELETHKCGWWIDLEEDILVNTLRIAMQTTVDDLEVMGRNGINLIKNNYNIINTSLKIKDLYKEICSLQLK